jgi:hypothetical protein
LALATSGVHRQPSQRLLRSVAAARMAGLPRGTVPRPRAASILLKARWARSHQEESMLSGKPLVPDHKSLVFVDEKTQALAHDNCAIATRDHAVIRRWAARHQAEPATGEQTPSGPGTAVHVDDGDAGIRFNFPGFAPFRPISWEEWFDHFVRHGLAFVCEPEVDGQPPVNTYRIVRETDLRA